MPKEKRSNKRVIVLLVVVFIVLIVSSLFLIIFSKRPLVSVVYPVMYYVQIGSQGFDVNNTVFTFGSINPGSSARRFFNVTNDYPYPLVVKASVSKNIRDVIFIEDQVVDVGQTAMVPVRLSIPSDYPYGNYTGSITLNIYKAD